MSQNSRAPYRVVVWGPGMLGSLLLREVAQLPELELVGVLAYSPGKDGVDVGEYLGTDPLGVTMTTSKDRILAGHADCVLFCPRATAGADPDSQTTADVIRLLESGKNVVTAVGYHYPALHGDAFAARLDAACRAGGASLHSTGINPGLLNERFMTTLSAVCTRIDSIVVQEIGVGGSVDSADMMRMIGWEQPPPPAPFILDMAARYYGESVTHACALLGRTVERIEPKCDFVVARRDYELKGMTVPEGTMGAVVHKFTGIVDSKPFLRLEEYFVADAELAPFPLSSPDLWTITIEGAPTSVRASIAMQHSFARQLRFAAGDSTPPGYYATGVAMLQAIPVVIGAPPGIVYPSVFTRSVPDLRILEATR